MRIDLNADLGEGFQHDALLLAHVSSASVACGAHAGDDASMATTCALAVQHRVTIGAHVAYADRADFGRRELGLTPDAIEALALAQIAALRHHAEAAGAAARFLKPHGALYHRASHDDAVAAALVRAARAGKLTAVLAAPGSALLAAAAQSGLAAVAEGFADRAYARDGSLVARTQPGAVLAAPAAAVQAVRLAREHTVVTDTDDELHLAVASLCLHGDSPDVPALLAAITAALAGAGIAVHPFA